MFETQKSGNMTSSGDICLDIRTHASPKVQSWTGPGVRRSKRPLLACRTRWKCSLETSHNEVKVKFGNKVQISKGSEIGVMSHQWRVSLYMVILQNIV